MLMILNVYICCVVLFEIIKLWAKADSLYEELVLIEIWQNEKVNWFGKLLSTLGWLLLFPITFIISVLIILSKIGVKE